MIYLENITKEFSNNTRVLDNVTLHIRPKEFAVIVGESGAGKTTLLKVITREDIPTKGDIFVGGINYKNLKRSDIPYLRRKIGVVFQDFKLLPKKNVHENIAYSLEVAGVKTTDIKSRVPKVLDLIGMTHLAKNFPDELSGGEQQRVAIGRAIINQPRILIADEPTGNLDPKNAWNIIDLLMKINGLGTTVLLTTHNKDIVDKIKKRVIVLKDGKVKSDKKGAGYHE